MVGRTERGQRAPSRCRCAKRRLRLETLEPRQLLACDLPAIADPAALEGCQCPVCLGLVLAAEPAALQIVESGASVSLANLPRLSSNSAAAAKLFLDFDGHFAATWSFRTNLTTPAFDNDGDPLAFSPTELSAIHEIWARVAEDFAPFQLDVTTIDPGHQTDHQVAVIAIGGSHSDWYGAAAGGVAITGGFANSGPNVAYVFSQSLGGHPKYVAEAAAHEAGHLFGLAHQAVWTGTSLTDPVHRGSGDWAPVMGSSYAAPRTTWHNGPTPAGATTYQDDMALIAGSHNRFGYRADDYGNTPQTAAPLPITAGRVALTGMVERADDQDVWSLTTGGGSLDLALAGIAVGSNLDAVLELIRGDGTLVVRAAPADSLGARVQTNLAAGTYYLMARSAGDYGNVGQYTLTGTLAEVDTTPPTVDIVDVSPDPRNSHAGLVRIAFSEPVQGVKASAFSLTRNGAIVSLATAPLTGTDRDYQLDLTTVTALPGSYVLTLPAAGSGIHDMAGNLLTSNATDAWVTDTVAPQADLLDVAPDPRNSSAGLVRLNFSEPVAGLDLSNFRLTRSGVLVPLPAGSLTGQGATYLLDLASTTAAQGSYVLRLVAAGSGIRDAAGNLLVADALDSWIVDTTAPQGVLGQVIPSPRRTSLAAVAVNFTEAVTGVRVNDFALTRDGVPILLAGHELSGSGDRYGLDLSQLTALPGAYALRLVSGSSGIRDAAGNPLAADATVAWQTDTTAPGAAFVNVPTSPRNTPVGPLTIQFTEPVTGFEGTDLRLTRDGVAVSLPATSLSGSGATYGLDLSPVTDLPGAYELRLLAASVTDLAGNPLGGDASTAWVLDVVPPTVDILDVIPDPRRSAVGLVTFQFSEPVQNVDATDFVLLRDGLPVALAPPLLSGGGHTYTLDLSTLTSAPGIYVLRLVASGSGIRDTAGNLLAAEAHEEWRNDARRPTGRFDVVTPNPRNQAVATLLLTFDEPVSGVDVADFTMTLNGTAAPLDPDALRGSGAAYTLDFASVTLLEGAYLLRLRSADSQITDGAGNSLDSDVFTHWEIDTTPPTVLVHTHRHTNHDLEDAVTRITLTFTEPVSHIELAQLQLWRDEVRLSLGSVVARSGNTYDLELGDATHRPGNYQFVLPGGSIRDLAGNAGAADVVHAWKTTPFNPWHHRADPLNVDGRGGITAQDLLTLINELNARVFSDPTTFQLRTAENPLGLYFDVNNDQRLTASDCMAVINFLNAYGPRAAAAAAEGEALGKPSGSPAPSELTPELLHLLASDLNSTGPRRQRR